MTAPKRHLRPVAPVFASAPPPSRLRRAWDVVVDFAFMAAAVAAVFWSDRRRARRWQP
jgi:hypothetical protein